MKLEFILKLKIKHNDWLQLLRFILRLRLYSSFITSRPGNNNDGHNNVAKMWQNLDNDVVVLNVVFTIFNYVTRPFHSISSGDVTVQVHVL